MKRYFAFLIALIVLIALDTRAAEQTITLQPGDSVKVIAAQGSGPPPPVVVPPGNITCVGFARTVVLELNWQNPTRLYTGAFADNEALVIKFTTGNVSTSSSLPRIASAEWQSPPSERIGVLSSSPCDFNHQATPGAYNQGNSITSVFALGTGTGYGYYPVLALGTPYYLNIKNVPNSTCAGGACDMFVDLVRPGGL